MSTQPLEAVQPVYKPKFSGLRRFGLIFISNLRLYTRRRVALFWNLLFPIALTLLFGSIYGNKAIDPNDPNSVKIVSFIIPNMVVMSLMSTGIMGNAATLANWREQGVLRRLQTTPLPIWQMLVSRIILLALMAVVQAFIIIGVGVLVFGASYSIIGLVQAIPFIILGALMCMAIGQLVAALVAKAETVQIVCQFIYLPLMFLGGLFIPLNQMPEILQTLGKWLPSGVLGDIIRAPMLDSLQLGSITATNLPLLVSLTVTLVYFVILTALATRFFKWS